MTASIVAGHQPIKDTLACEFGRNLQLPGSSGTLLSSNMEGPGLSASGQPEVLLAGQVLRADTWVEGPPEEKSAGP